MPGLVFVFWQSLHLIAILQVHTTQKHFFRHASRRNVRAPKYLSSLEESCKAKPRLTFSPFYANEDKIISAMGTKESFYFFLFFLFDSRLNLFLVILELKQAFVECQSLIDRFPLSERRFYSVFFLEKKSEMGRKSSQTFFVTTNVVTTWYNTKRRA